MNDPSVRTVTLRGLEGNPTSHLNALQLAIAPHLDLMVAFWWIVWITTLLYLLSTYILIPLLVRRKK